MTEKTNEEKKVLLIGLCCIDLVLYCDSYPAEDTDKRLQSYRRYRGGNASNSATVLSILLPGRVDLATSIPLNHKTCCRKFLEDDLKNCNIGSENLWNYYSTSDSQQCPICFIVLSRENGSRTIMNGIPVVHEYPLEKFCSINLSSYDWIHLEGRRNLDEIQQMVKMIVSHRQSSKETVKISMEFEKPRFPTKLLQLEGMELVLMSREYAQSMGYWSKKSAAEELAKIYPSLRVVVAWGADGCSCADRGQVSLLAGQPVPGGRPVNTLAAGDCFNSLIIYKLRHGSCSLAEACRFACEFAAKKCSVDSLQEMGSFLSL